MNKQSLKKIIKQILKEEFESNEDHVDFLIKEYIQSKDELEKFMNEFGHVIAKHQTLTKDEKTKLGAVEKMMSKFKIVKRVADKMIFEIVNGPKYKVIRPDYKAIFEKSMSKLNAATQKIIESIKDEQIQSKGKETSSTLQISKLDENGGSLSDDLSDIISGMKEFADAAKTIQKIKNA